LKGRIRKQVSNKIKTSLNKGDKDNYYYVILCCNFAVLRDEFDHGRGMTSLSCAQGGKKLGLTLICSAVILGGTEILKMNVLFLFLSCMNFILFCHVISHAIQFCNSYED